MMNSGQTLPSQRLRWDIWWRWALISFLGIIVGSMLYNLLPDALANPQADEDIWLEQPWRVAVLACIYYTPIALAQWLVLWRYVPRAWWWLIITVGSVVVIYPGSIWLLWNIRQWDLASDVWFLGLEGGSVYVVAQWLALRRWTRSPGIWGIWFVATSLGWLCVMSVIALFSAGIAESPPYGSLSALLHGLALAGLYQLLIGGALAALLQPAT